MKKHVKTSLLLMAVTASPAWAGSSADGTKIGNGDGGDAVYCAWSRGSDMSEGYYFLDYLVTMDMDFGEDATVANWNQSASRIQNIFASISPGMAASFKSFVQDTANHHDYTRPHVWEPATEILAINDQKLVSSVPANCKNGDNIKLFQVVAHQNDVVSGRPSGQRVYTYLPKMFIELSKTSPLQLSYLYTHEWLWKHSSNINRNRRINRMIHSAKIEEMSPTEITNQLLGMGFDLNQFGPLTPPSNSPAKPRVDYNPAESDTEVKNLFETKDYCKSRINENSKNRYDLGRQPNFRFYGWSRNFGSDHGHTSTFGLSRTDKTKPQPKSGYNLSAKLVTGVGPEGYLFDIQLDGGEVQFHCEGWYDRDRQPWDESLVKCTAFATDNGEKLIEPVSQMPLELYGEFYAGCFIAKTENFYLDSEMQKEGRVMIIGEF